MRPGRILVVVSSALATWGGCNETFEPKGPFEQKPVVYAILTTLSDTQYVRLYMTYNPSGFDPLEITTDNAVIGARVSVTSISGSFQFHDTTITRGDKGRYSTDVKAYVAYGFSVERGKSYSIHARIGQGEEYTTTITVPVDGTIQDNNFFLLSNPYLFADDDNIDLRCVFSSLTQGFLIRAFIEYQLLIDNVWTPMREEIPAAISNLIDCEQYDPVYPRLQRRNTTQSQQILFPAIAYKTTLKNMENN